MKNWSGHVDFTAESLSTPRTVSELQRLVATSPRIRALGTGHSFNDLANTDGVHVSLTALDQEVTIDTDARVAWIPAAMRYGQAARLLDAEGWAVGNMASLGHISVAGTVATGTHGSGDRNPTLSASVAALELVTADGDIVIVDDDNPDLPRAGAIVSLGCIGVVVRVALRIEPRFSIRQYVTDDIALDRIQEEFDDVFSSAYSVSYFTTWDARRTGQVWMKRREGQDPAWSEAEWMGGRPAPVKRHPLPGHDAVHCTEQGGERGPWHERLPHFKLEFTPSSGDELQTEYLVPRAHAVAALEEVSAIAGRIAPLLRVSEVRTMAADDLWLSGAFGRETVGIHFTWRKTPEVLAILPTLDTLFAAHSGRPHWGKLFELTSPLASRYPHFSDFIQLMSAVDPSSKFRNRLVDAVFGN